MSDLIRRAQAIPASHALGLTASLGSTEHLEKLAVTATNAAAVQGLHRLVDHFNLVIDCLEQSKAIADAGFSIEWTAGLKSMEPVPIRSELPIFVPSRIDTLRLKAFTLVALNRVRDYLDLIELSTKAGHRPAAAALAVLDHTFPGQDPERAPLATQLVRRLAKPRPRIRKVSSLTGSPPTPDRWAAMCDTATALSSHILLSPEPRGAVRAPIQDLTFDETVRSIGEGDLVLWQQMASVVQARPWGEFARQIEAAGKAAGDDAVACAFDEVVKMSRVQRDRRERDEVAKRISKIVLTTGLTQKVFAARIGTSASRLSTYMTGSVTPSASMMLRIEAQRAEIHEERKSDPL
ncbi:MAG: helix-turn-helix transcriptional regulator [Aeromicrobium sp.]